jgi:DNA-binding PadR family transcriptional regulator
VQGIIAARCHEMVSVRRRKYYSLQRMGRQALKQQKEQWLLVHNTLAAAWGASA